MSGFVHRPAEFLGLILVGNNFALVVYGSVMSTLLELPVRQWLGTTYATPTLELLVQSVLSTLVVLVLGEFLPKSLFTLAADRLLLSLAVPVQVCYYLFYPLVKGVGSGTAKGSGPPLATKQLFGITLKARKLGVVVSVNMRAQNQGVLPGIFEEIFKEFPDADIFLTNGGGMMDWKKALQQFDDEVAARKKKEKETGKRIPGANTMEKPKVARFNSGEALDWPPVRGSTLGEDYVGLKAKHPELFQDLRKRGNVWFVTSYKDANAAYLAFEDLVKRGAEAIYWYNAFDSPIEGEVAEELAQRLTEKKVEILVQNQGKRVEGMDWLKRVEAKFVK